MKNLLKEFKAFASGGNLIDLAIGFVGPFKPNTFGPGYALGVKPGMYAGFSSPIPAHHNVRQPPPKKANPKK